MDRTLQIITAPSPLGLRPPAPGRIPGVRRMPAALLAAGLLDGLPAVARTELPEPPYVPEPDPRSGTRNLPALVGFTRLLEQAVSGAFATRRLPVILGGDCSVLLGPALALRRRGRYGLVHLDGHSDFAHEGNTGAPYPNVAGADLAVVTGRGPEALTHLAGLRPYFRDEDVIQLGDKEDPQSPGYSWSDLPATAIHLAPLAEVRRLGLAGVLHRITALLDHAPTEGFWLHIDVDVLDPQLMPAVDSPDPGGFTWEEFDATLTALLAHPKFVGVNIGIYDPDLDPDGTHARRISALLRRHLAGLSAR